MSVIERAIKTGSIALRLVVLGFLILIFFLPTSMVQRLIAERSDRKTAAVNEVSSKWGGSQNIIGPILVVPYYPFNGLTEKNKNAIDPSQLRLAYFVPDNLKISGSVKSQLRARGIYTVPLFDGDIKVEGSFKDLDLDAIGLTNDKMYWNRAYVVFGGLDLTGLKSKNPFVWSGKNLSFSASNNKSKLFKTELVSPVAMSNNPAAESYNFSTTFSIRGSQSLFFVPVGRQNNVALSSDWSSPSFDGSILPTNHNVTDAGFSADWQVLDLNRNLPNSWLDSQQISLEAAVLGNFAQQMNSRYGYEGETFDSSVKYNFGAFGVRFFQPVDVYQKSTRSAKYAMAVIALVFLIYFLVESASRRRVNPFQYILVGFALCIFYTLLLSISEYLSFGAAYLIASTGVVTMIGLFTKSVLSSWRLGGITAGILVFLYGFVYVLLQSKDYTLLIGSIGLFIILGLIMYFSRYINWYAEVGGSTNEIK